MGAGAGGEGDQTKDSKLRTWTLQRSGGERAGLFHFSGSGTEAVHVRSVELVKGLMILGNWASESHRETRMSQDLG